MHPNNKYNLALIGFGGVNRALAELILEKRELLKKEFGLSLHIVAVSDLYLGSAYHPEGLGLNHLCTLGKEKGALKTLPQGAGTENNERIIKHSNADIICEATFTNAHTGQPAIEHCEWAFASRKHVVTTNKGPIALKGHELLLQAKKHGVCFGFEGSVMSGTPVLRFVKETLKGCSILGVRGILNGTANYVLGLVEKGHSFKEAIETAQQLGYAEADPSADIEGWDVFLKVGILAHHIMGRKISLDAISREGIDQLTEEQVRTALNEGKRWKLVGEIVKGDANTVTASVKPQLLPLEDQLAGVNGATNAISFNTDLLGEVMVSGPGAGKIETAYALLADIIEIATLSTPSL